jgi:hypothetical protein
MGSTVNAPRFSWASTTSRFLFCSARSRAVPTTSSMREMSWTVSGLSSKRKTHMRATIVEGEDAPAIEDDKDRPMATVHNEPSLRLQLLKASREREFFVRRVYRHTSPVPLGATHHQHRHPLAKTRPGEQ